MDWKTLFAEHLKIRQAKTEAILAAEKLDGLVIDAGPLTYYTEDDQSVPFRRYHHFAHFCPVEGENHVLVIRPGKKPQLLHFTPQDFWHEYQPLGSPFWADGFDIQIFDSADKIWQEVAAYKNFGYVGPQSSRAKATGLVVDRDTLKKRLEWERSFKSAYEVACTEEAERLGAAGHKAARDAFFSGASELQIHYAYLRGTGLLEREMPYETIVALNEKGATLHYAYKRADAADGKVLLIDAGATFRAYCSDITRTYATDKALPEFRQMIADLDVAQQKLCEGVTPGRSMGDLHSDSHRAIARILLDHGLLKGCDEEMAMREGFTRAFYPHGIGHLLGIFVHDVAGQCQDAIGTPSAPHAQFPKLRTTRRFEPGMLVTVEPGIYFIEMLLAPYRTGDFKRYFDFAKIDRYAPHGGIRIEDDVLVTPQGMKNLTRPYLP